MRHIFIIGSKSIGQYGGFETFVDRLTEQHREDSALQYHIACKANGDGCMDESRLSGVSDRRTEDGAQTFRYHGAHVFKLPVPDIGPAVAIWYDLAALRWSVRYCRKNGIRKPVFYILACRIGPFIRPFARQIHGLGGVFFLNPDGHEWKRAKWSAPIRRYWKLSERQMVHAADLVVCDSLTIEQYIRTEYRQFHPETVYISYGSDTVPSALSDDDARFVSWMKEKNLVPGGYYLVVGRFVPENNYETMLREFMKSGSGKAFALITNVNDRFLEELEEKLHFRKDPRIRFVGTVYDPELLKKIRENAWGYFHGHEVGGTNPSLLEALGSTKLNLLLDVGFNREVAEDAAVYWTKEEGSLCARIEEADRMDQRERDAYGRMAKERIRSAYSWKSIGDQYRRLWLYGRKGDRIS